jgi:protein-S-isoprenylcysteine O-methyltransferase Ste14
MADSESKDIPGVVAPPPLIFAVPLGLGLVAQHFWPVQILPPDSGRLAGIGCIVAGLAGLAGRIAFSRAGTSPNPWTPTSALVVSGVYRYTRNPMYLGLTLIYIGITLWVDTPWPLLPLPIVLAVIQRGVIAREERYLEARFGEEYRQYRARVRRWI